MIGTHLGSWVIEKELGRGGMGTVYLGRKAADAGPEVAEFAAIKVLSPELAADSGFLQRFQREVDALRQLDHPGIVRYYDSGCEEGRSFYAMEYVAGCNFDELLQQRHRLPFREVLHMALQICPAIKHAHDHGIIHRDIKPQNLMRDDAGTVKLADFGVAKVFAGQQLTAVGGLVGTAEYISPEQASGRPVSIRSDLYSFGVVLYTLLTGRLPFQGETVLDLIHKHRYAQFDATGKLVDDLPYELDELVCTLMAKDPSDRPPNALVLLRMLESIDRKIARKESLTVASARIEATKAENQAPVVIESEPGPATLMSRLMRRELEAQRRGTAVGRFFNHPAVLVVLLFLSVGVIGWRFWPASAAALFAGGERLMQSDNSYDWERAEVDYFTPLDRRFPDHPYADQVKEYRQHREEVLAERRARSTPDLSVPSEAQRFYLLGQRQRKNGDPVAAARTFRNLITMFDGVPSEQKWVRVARKAVSELPKELPSENERWKPVQAALARSKGLERGEAEKVWRAVEELYRDDPSAAGILEEVKKLRESVAPPKPAGG